MSQILRGFVGQRMDGRKRRYAGAGAVFPPIAGSAAINFLAPVSGYWQFILWGPGGLVNAGVISGASGAYAEVTALLNPTQTVVITPGLLGTDTTVLLPNGRLITAGKATLGAPGAAIGGDFNLSGSAGVASGVGLAGQGTGAGAGSTATPGAAGASARLPWRGGVGGSGSFGTGQDTGPVGVGLVIALFIKPPFGKV